MIEMASHGQRGIWAVLLGSETLKVPTHSTIPVIVCRRPRLLPSFKIHSRRSWSCPQLTNERGYLQTRGVRRLTHLVHRD